MCSGLSFSRRTWPLITYWGGTYSRYIIHVYMYFLVCTPKSWKCQIVQGGSLTASFFVCVVLHNVAPIGTLISWCTRLWLTFVSYVKSFFRLRYFKLLVLLVTDLTKMMFFCRLGVLACYLDPLELGSYLQGSAVPLALWQQLAQCMTKGLISDSGRVSSTC